SVDDPGYPLLPLGRIAHRIQSLSLTGLDALPLKLYLSCGEFGIWTGSNMLRGNIISALEQSAIEGLRSLLEFHLLRSELLLRKEAGDLTAITISGGG